MLGREELQHTERIDMNQVIDAMMPFFKLAIVLFAIETVFDMFWREHKKAKRERVRGSGRSGGRNTKTVAWRTMPSMRRLPARCDMTSCAATDSNASGAVEAARMA